ncbi:MAG: GNAT family N-acetyltransferase [Clostridiales bacterium]|nr:GNAT family N-acetyltransferase [Clostridiales bacterium]
MSEIVPVSRYLTEEEKGLSRSLYEAVFSEDTKKFVDYYYQYKTKDNEILVLEEEGQIVSMLHLNPYMMIVNGYEVKSSYIVAVATHKEYRHRGYMRLLLEQALKDMAGRKMPFTFLMPASESIYAPFDFVWICPYTTLPRQVEQMDAEGQNLYLASQYQLFCKRDARYMENREAEQRAEEGESPEGKIPPYMARITDVCRMLSMVNSFQKRELYLHVKDPIIESNDGYFCWESSREYSRAEKLTEIPERIDMELTIGELTSMIFQSFRSCLSELV